ncbi:hypothetical protein MARPO_0194s0011 [Marchantia polymorpha]|uniref:Uncharacterized protein n=1 Tax=Marchantia polymorpha TaxID=3197 RepID=A0A2R6W111_MARPO|nr:hypothetical protein MARPO_0194s0011 [Marchantia polymorpha]|eukprot:PTQ27533.1 hypothetical protein MARPO_0194s0011 [Marchantia polymorpha]
MTFGMISYSLKITPLLPLPAPPPPPSQRDVEMQDEVNLLAQKRSVPSTNSSLDLVLEEMDALAQRSHENLTNLDRVSPDHHRHSPKARSVHWPENVEGGERTPKRLKSDSCSTRQLQAPTAREVGPIPNTGSNDASLTLLPLELLDLEGPDSAGNEFQRLEGLESSKLSSSNGQGFTMDIEGPTHSTSSPDTTSSDSQKSTPHSRSAESVSKNPQPPPGSFALAKSFAGNSQFHCLEPEKDQNVSPNVFRSLPMVGLTGTQGQRLPVPSVSLPKGTAGGGRSGSTHLMERNVGGRIGANGGAHNESSVARESRWAEQLLLDCAVAISSKNFVRTQHLMWVLNDLSNLTGDANQRLAAHGLKALFCRVNGTAEAAGTSPIQGQMNAIPKLVHRALQKFHDVNPWHQMVYTVANSVMLENFEGEDKVHVIDIGVSQGTQWPTFIEALATRASGPPSLLRLTVVKEEEGAGFPAFPLGPSSTDFMARLERFAKLMGINIALSSVVSSLEGLTREKLGIREGEALAVCTQFRLHRLSETIGSEDQRCLSPRDSFLQFLHGLKPKVLILSENDADHLSTDFLTRFRPVVDYFWKFLDSTSFSFHGKHCEERQIIEDGEARTLINNVACEGEQRIERNESHLGWTLRMKNSGFHPVLPKEEILDNIRGLIRKYDANWEYAVDTDCVVLLWKQQPVTFCSVWKPSLPLHMSGDEI